MSSESKKDSAYAQAFPPTTTTINTTTEEAQNNLQSKRLVFIVDGTRSMDHQVAQVRKLAVEVGAIARMIGITVYYCIYTDYHWDQNRQIGGPLVEGRNYVVLVIDGNRPFIDVERDLNRYYQADTKPNGDEDEAQKTALQYLLQNEYLTGPENTLIVHMTDSLPHDDNIDTCITREGEGNSLRSNGYHEINALESKNWCHVWDIICISVKSKATVLTSYKVPDYIKRFNTNECHKYEEIYKMLGFAVPRYLTTEEMSRIILHAFGLAEPLLEVIELPQLANLTLKDVCSIVPLSKMISTLEYIILKNPMLLILNPILGFIWRHVCKNRKNPMHEDKITILCNSLSKHTGYSSTLRLEDIQKLKKFIQDSYSNKDAIIEILQPFCVGEPQKFIVIDGEAYISQDDLLALTRGAPKSACRAAAELLQKIVTCEGTLTPTSDNCSFIPIRLFEESPSTAFKLLPHLLFPGIEFGIRGAKIMAVLSFKNALLRKYAKNFLLSSIRKKGYLFDFSFDDSGKPNVPENWSVGFFVNILSEGRQFLDPRTDISLRIDILKIVQKIKRNALASITCNIGKRPSSSWKKESVPDRKRQCVTCHQFRSDTICTKEDKCGLCAYCDTPKGKEEYNYLKICQEFPDSDENMSSMTECSGCGIIYAVRHTKVLTQNPKCYYCRDGAETPAENIDTCDLCRRKFCGPLGSTKGYVCASCEDTGEPTIQEYDTSVQDILRHNIVLGCNPTILHKILNKSLKDYLRSPEFLELECLLPTLGPHLLNGYEESGASGESKRQSKRQSNRQSKRQSKHDSRTIYANNGKYEILDPSETIDKLLEALKGNGMGTCSISYIDVPLGQLLCCGNPGCDNPMSIDSWKSIFRPVQPGHPVHNTNLCCPFCRRRPSYDIVKKAAKHIRNISGLGRFLDSGTNETYWCGWCIECNQIKAMAPRGGDCNAPMPTTTNFKCTDCTHSDILASAADGYAGDQKQCPNCGIMIVKDDDGQRRCWHVECTSCGVHICWKDGKCFDNADDCYDYMWATHDSIGYT